MNYLIDTHVLLWWYEDPSKLKESTLKIISNRDNSIYVSDVVIWEIVIKVSIGKLKPKQNIYQEIEKDFELLPIKSTHIHRIANLESIHRDPFDRLLIAQSIEEDMTVITHDKLILKYDIKTIKA